MNPVYSLDLSKEYHNDIMKRAERIRLIQQAKLNTKINKDNKK